MICPFAAAAAVVVVGVVETAEVLETAVVLV